MSCVDTITKNCLHYSILSSWLRNISDEYINYINTSNASNELTKESDVVIIIRFGVHHPHHRLCAVFISEKK